MARAESERVLAAAWRCLDHACSKTTHPSSAEAKFKSACGCPLVSQPFQACGA